MLKYVDSMSRIPPQGYQYIHPEDGHITSHIVLREAVAEAVRYRTINHYPVPADFQQQFEDLDCRRKPPGFCMEVQTGQNYTPLVRKPLTATEMLSGSKFLVDYLLNGEFAPDEEIAKRIAICTGCPANVSFEGSCLTCGASKTAHATMNAIVAKHPFKGDDKMRACYYCGCSNKAQTRVKLDLIQKHLRPEINAQLPSHCWKKIK